MLMLWLKVGVGRGLFGGDENAEYNYTYGEYC